MAGASFPVPIGVTASFSNVQANVATAAFYLPPGLVVVTFQANDENNPGTLTMKDSGGNVQVTMTEPGYATLVVPGETGVENAGGNYTFVCTAVANLVAATVPSVWR